ncbi:non-histone chromosomal protein 6 [Bailinhaonella thermotolerans]|uniref:HMG box domain-containing protein n=1 Tax=Bailinhaonella thermotolerans TaxID=1070861 RepID=A0A3A4ANR4_9ACTN|nr:non-histone chromosomal protein 6 [Bailinhaonella thermotolerans]RJL30105.1 hypothetical protein D5H75_24605 [Bailinhaonella thermotolerans]
MAKGKDPEAPKRPRSAYMYFSQDKRDEVVKENPDVGFGQIGKILGERWRSLGPEEKRPYEEKADADRRRYDEEKT